MRSASPLPSASSSPWTWGSAKHMPFSIVGILSPVLSRRRAPGGHHHSDRSVWTRLRRHPHGAARATSSATTFERGLIIATGTEPRAPRSSHFALLFVDHRLTHRRHLSPAASWIVELSAFVRRRRAPGGHHHSD